MNCLKTIPIKMNCLKTIPIKMNNSFVLKTIPIKMNCLKTIPKLSISRLNVPPKCIDCKYNVIHYEKTICTKFKYVSVMTDYGNFNYYMDSITCREDINLCGPSGCYFELK